jgi:hypothetical protein
MLEAGELSVDLRRQPSLGGEAALASGRTTVLVDGWRIEALRRYEPIVVWRHDGSEEADEEIVLGVRSMVAHGGYDGVVRVETRLDPAEIRDRCGLDDRLEFGRPPEGRCGLLPWDRAVDSGEAGRRPLLLLANGVTCHRALDPMLQALAAADTVALLPWVWDAAAAPVDEAELFARDPAEAASVRACIGAIVGLPDLHRSAEIRRLVATIAANRPSPASGTDGFEDALLRYVVGRAGGADTGLLSGFASTARAQQFGPGIEAHAIGRPTLINHRALPAAIRADAMRASLGAPAA